MTGYARIGFLEGKGIGDKLFLIWLWVVELPDELLQLLLSRAFEAGVVE